MRIRDPTDLVIILIPNVGYTAKIHNIKRYYGGIMLGNMNLLRSINFRRYRNVIVQF